MRAIISGAGAAGLLHALAYRASRVDVAAVFDPDPARAKNLAELFGARVAPTFDELVRHDAELASVCGPPAVHVAQAEALARGRIVFVEKPVATSPSELERLAATRRCVPVVQWRAGRAARALRRAIAHGELGSAPVASCDLAWGRDDAYFAARGPTWGCGALLSIGIHALDLMTWTLGASARASSPRLATEPSSVIEAVSGMTAPASRRDAVGETGAVALLRFGSGALLSMRISLDGGADTTRIVVCGRGVTATIEGGEADPTASSIRWSARDAKAIARLESLERDTPGSLGPPLIVPYMGAAIAAIREGQAPGESESLPSVGETSEAHAAAMCIAANACRRGTKAA
ncbi:MAG TPA: Gfo/Idh/MocA family oxidoreductase [Labilithrix sp.]|jgi:predicted dehydrogenase